MAFCDTLADIERGGTDPSPGRWRCPRCQGPIVRMFHETTAPDEQSRYVDDVADWRAERAGYRCRMAACGWEGWVMV